MNWSLATAILASKAFKTASSWDLNAPPSLFATTQDGNAKTKNDTRSRMQEQERRARPIQPRRKTGLLARRTIHHRHHHAIRLEECNPDVGILTCTEDASQCVRDLDSSLGGLCTTTKTMPTPPADVVGHRRLFSQIHVDYIDIKCKTDDDNPCDCSDFNRTTLTGTVSCTYTDLCYDSDGSCLTCRGAFTVHTIANSLAESVEYCSESTVNGDPHELCITYYDFGNDGNMTTWNVPSSCTASLNGNDCDDCGMPPNPSLDDVADTNCSSVGGVNGGVLYQPNDCIDDPTVPVDCRFHCPVGAWGYPYDRETAIDLPNYGESTCDRMWNYLWQDPFPVGECRALEEIFNTECCKRVPPNPPDGEIALPADDHSSTNITAPTEDATTVDDPDELSDTLAPTTTLTTNTSASVVEEESSEALATVSPTTSEATATPSADFPPPQESQEIDADAAVSGATDGLLKTTASVAMAVCTTILFCRS